MHERPRLRREGRARDVPTSSLPVPRPLEGVATELALRADEDSLRFGAEREFGVRLNEYGEAEVVTLPISLKVIP